MDAPYDGAGKRAGGKHTKSIRRRQQQQPSQSQSPGPSPPPPQQQQQQQQQQQAQSSQPPLPSAGGILDKDVAALLAPSPPAAPAAERSLDEELERRRTLHELDLVFGGLATSSSSSAPASPSRSRPRRRPVETADARERREELLYESVIRIFEIQLKQERREAEARRQGRGPSLGSLFAPAASAPSSSSATAATAGAARSAGLSLLPPPTPAPPSPSVLGGLLPRLPSLSLFSRKS